jgi:protease I
MYTERRMSGQKESTMNRPLEGRKIAMIATDGFEQSELIEPKKNLERAGAHVMVLSLKMGEIKGWDKTDWGSTVRVDGMVSEARPNAFDALVLPGGVMNPDKLRMDKAAVAFVKQFAETGKPVAAICHGPWMLIEAGVVRGRTMTSWPSVSTDLKNAGAKWVDREVAVDGNLITSRKPQDIAAFSEAIIDAVSNQTMHARAA